MNSTQAEATPPGQEYEFHPYANIFPLLGVPELDQLSGDIGEHGLQMPIVLHEGRILEGRNRYRACQLAEAEPRFVQYEGNDSLAFAISMNLHGRHLTTGQRAAIAEKIATMRQGERTDLEPSLKLDEVAAAKSLQEAAKEMHVSRATVAASRAIKTTDPELAAKVHAGRIKLQDAKREIKKREIAARIERISTEPHTTAVIQPPYEIIVADPPWRYDNVQIASPGRQIESHYPTAHWTKLSRTSIALP
jgi:hypothetical protein